MIRENGSFHIIIPARYASSRLPGKLLMDLGGQTVLERVYRQALLAQPASLCIATDSQKIADHAQTFCADVRMTAMHHASGTERLAEVVSQASYPDNAIIVNVQGDEPFLDPQLIQQVARILSDNSALPMATLCWPIQSLEQWHDPNTVKVVCDQKNRALYFSRHAIPRDRNDENQFQAGLRHIGLYAYRAYFFQEMQKWPVSCPLAELEGLEQLRVLWMGYDIAVEQACVAPKTDINTQSDLIHARQMFDPNIP